MANNNHFNLTLDTLAPTGSITRPAAFINENKNLVIVGNGDPVYMKVWYTKTSAPATKEDEEYLAAQWEAFSTTKKTNCVEEGDYYYHLVLKDDVENESDIYDAQ